MGRVSQLASYKRSSTPPPPPPPFLMLKVGHWCPAPVYVCCVLYVLCVFLVCWGEVSGCFLLLIGVLYTSYICIHVHVYQPLQPILWVLGTHRLPILTLCVVAAWGIYAMRPGKFLMQRVFCQVLTWLHIQLHCLQGSIHRRGSSPSS